MGRKKAINRSCEGNRKPKKDEDEDEEEDYKKRRKAYQIRRLPAEGNDLETAANATLPGHVVILTQNDWTGWDSYWT